MTSSAYRWGFVGLLMAALCGCGDDASGMDAGGGDAGRPDGGSMPDTGPRDTGVRRDTGPRDAGGSMDECDPWMPGSCPEGEKCSVVIEVRPEPEMNILFFGCVPRDRPRTEGQFCGLFGADATPDDDTDDFRTDVCEEGLFCWNEPGGGPLDTCQRLCGGETSPGCPAGNFCQGLSDVPAFGVCEAADNCDPVYQTGCTGDEGCYLITDTAGDIVTSCFPFVPDEMVMPPPAGEPGEPCPYINGCRPGAQCFGDMLPGGVTGDRICYEICAAGMGGPLVDAGPVDSGPGTDAGPPDMDAGPPPVDAGPPPVDAGPPDSGRPPRTGMCMGTEMCVGLTPEMGTITSPTPPGICR